MQSTQDNDRSIPRHRLTDYPALAALRLENTDLNELKKQGRICVEWRQHRRYFKLRFRRRGTQVVRYVGNAQSAEAVTSELMVLQAEVRVSRDLKSVTRMAGKMLRNAKSRLKPILEANGLCFHGMSVRRPRQQSTDDPISTTEN